MAVCPYGVVRRRRRHITSRPTSDFYHVQSSRSPVRPLLGEAKPSCVYWILKPHGQSFRRPVRLLLREAKLSYMYWILRSYGQNFENPCQTTATQGEAKPSYIYTILKKRSHPQSISKAVVCVRTPRMYPCSGYFLVK